MNHEIYIWYASKLGNIFKSQTVKKDIFERSLCKKYWTIGKIKICSWEILPHASQKCIKNKNFLFLLMHTKPIYLTNFKLFLKIGQIEGCCMHQWKKKTINFNVFLASMWQDLSGTYFVFTYGSILLWQWPLENIFFFGWWLKNVF